eukprot:gnl/MRDRNA2_/MRDRNA2_76938_c0_seq3.p1 gnl/MRDRNA2_/MRDRNA2_76938_c0~~gnl/MRDRNA2_/MRDRNA2_76938_c0_seq3.p1  ORF type:complete len:138 (-),score=16.43 gnl/MRDRNA2_/MRDRNA2_76938_c0_seq3:60-473(-)
MGVQRRDVCPEHGPNVTLIRHAYVRMAWQRRGFGTRVLQHLLDGQESGRPVLIGTWATNHEAISFYQKHGFELVANAVRKNELLRIYWFAGGELGASNDGETEYRKKQMDASVVLASASWLAAEAAWSRDRDHPRIN